MAPAADPLTAIQQEPTSLLVARRIREAIASGALRPGQQLTEAYLAKALGVSRSPLREAMQRLTGEGLLVAHRNRGLFVQSMTDDEVEDMYLARTAIERSAAQALIDGESGAGAALLGVVDRMAASADGPPEEMTDLDIEFHRTLVQLVGSQRLTRMHDTLLTETRMCVRALERTYEDQTVRVAEHRAIAEAIAGAQGAEVDRLLLEHMHDGIARITRAGPRDSSPAAGRASAASPEDQRQIGRAHV